MSVETGYRTKLETLHEAITDAGHLLTSTESPVRETEVVYSERISRVVDAEVWLVSELRQETGAYKIRGAYNAMSRLSDECSDVLAVSAGNHAQAVAICARLLGKQAVIFMPRNTPTLKVQKTLDYGKGSVSVHLAGENFDESKEACELHKANYGGSLVDPFDDPDVIAGQGTLGTEVNAKLDNIDAVFCPVGGGGLLSGVGTALRSDNPDTALYGVEPSGAASLTYAMKHRGAESLPGPIDTFVDGASVKKIGRIAYGYLSELNVVPTTVTNEEVCHATRLLWAEGYRAELAGAAALARVLTRKDDIAGQRLLVVVSGGNLSQERYASEVAPEHTIV